jgi:serine/threonine protein kinase
MSISSAFISGPTGLIVGGARLDMSDIRLPNMEVRRCLSHGALGGLYHAYDQIRRCDVALKARILFPATKERITAVLEREIKVGGMVPAHGGYLVAERLHFTTTEGGRELGIVEMPFAEGGSLRDWLRAHREDVQERRGQAPAIMRELCAAVGMLHAAGICHLDIKPENVLLASGQILLSDFGAAMVLPQRLAMDPTCADVARSDPSSGTPEYMSPERWISPDSGSVDARADIYSLGMVFHELMSRSGLPPFRGSPRRLARLHTEGMRPRIGGIPEAWESIIDRCVAKRMEDRYADTDDLLDAIDDATTDQDAREDDATSIDAVRDIVLKAINEGDPARAKRWCGRILEEYPGDEMAREVLAYVAERQAEADVLYEALGDRSGAVNLDEAVALLRRAMQCYPAHPREMLTVIRLANLAREYRENLAACRGACATGDFDSAHACAARAHALNGTAPGGIGRQRHEIDVWTARLNEAMDRNDIPETMLANNRLRLLGMPEILETS